MSILDDYFTLEWLPCKTGKEAKQEIHVFIRHEFVQVNSDRRTTASITL